MPSEKSARVALRRRATNTPLRTRAKSSVAKAHKLIAANDLDAAEKAARDAAIVLDKAAQRHAISPNNAARRKSRIAQELNRAKGRSSE